MKLLKLGIHNYKSLRSVVFQPRDLSVLLGPNGAGKSNFCDAIDFIGEMYQLGLEYAVARHGGYENIAYRHTRRSKSPITLDVVAELDQGEISLYRSRVPRLRRITKFVVEHSTSFATSSQRIESPFSIVYESFVLRAGTLEVLRFERKDDKIITQRMSGMKTIFVEGNDAPFASYVQGIIDTDFSSLELSSTQSMSSLLEARLSPLLSWTNRLGRLGLFQVSPNAGREPGVPTPQPQLGRNGSNLPAVVQHLKDQRKPQFNALMGALRQVMPTLEDVGVAFTPQRTQALTFKEEGFGRSWSVEEVSDGTVRALALIAATLDTTYQLTVIEEPENSLHPWAIRQFLEACRTAVSEKQIILTSHSPTLINQIRPEELWVVSRAEGETHIESLATLDPDAALGWKRGDFRLADYLDSGMVGQAVPGLFR